MSAPIATASEKTKTTRKPNWTGDENLLLVQLIAQNKSVIRGKFSHKVSAETKRSTWQMIATQLSASFPHVIRSVDECEKKWYNLFSKSRQEISAYRKQLTGTGGGPCGGTLSAVAETVQDILGETNVSISGLGDGVDTSLLQVVNMTSSLDTESLFETIHPLQPQSRTLEVPLSTSSSDAAHAVSTNHEHIKRQLELQVLEAKLQYYTLKIRKLKNEL